MASSAPSTALPPTAAPTPEGLQWKGFVAGVLSGATKLLVGQPFDLIKVRMQCSTEYRNAWHCLKSTLGKEGPLALYKGASPPAVGWVLSDMMLLGSLHNYRLMFARIEARQRGEDPATEVAAERLSLKAHAMSGAMAGWTCSLIMAPVDEIKSKLQMQTTGPKIYTGPIDVAKQLVKKSGPFAFWRNLPAAAAHRTFIGGLFCSYEVMTRAFHDVPEDSPWKVSNATATFIAGGLASNIFWASSYPLDAIKNRLMADSLIKPRYPTYASAARAIWAEGGMRSVFRGFLPAMLRAFPTNASALLVWETTMRLLGAEQTR
ncbi:mitochondrial carrier domain-containing protein [Leucosporidium creatinivorum]|uniref:Mitochondrial carrier domain-containing protein n=1 Tax=Leucosporidium creatinivorum TaxID=106004 RepID=A0A1Y2FYL0_9BASI|nr:mitochondrial carrier domain-containing protein [Leucosporidium creatinivorum]